jgi:hypothetical protein
MDDPKNAFLSDRPFLSFGLEIQDFRNLRFHNSPNSPHPQIHPLPYENFDYHVCPWLGGVRPILGGRMAILEWMEQTRLSIFINESSSLSDRRFSAFIRWSVSSCRGKRRSVHSDARSGIDDSSSAVEAPVPIHVGWFYPDAAFRRRTAMARATVLDESILIIKLVLVVPEGRHVEYSGRKVQQSGCFEKGRECAISCRSGNPDWFPVLTLGG